MKNLKHLLFLSILCSLILFTNCGHEEATVSTDPIIGSWSGSRTQQLGEEVFVEVDEKMTFNSDFSGDWSVTYEEEIISEQDPFEWANTSSTQKLDSTTQSYDLRFNYSIFLRTAIFSSNFSSVELCLIEGSECYNYTRD